MVRSSEYNTDDNNNSTTTTNSDINNNNTTNYNYINNITRCIELLFLTFFGSGRGVRVIGLYRGLGWVLRPYLDPIRNCFQALEDPYTGHYLNIVLRVATIFVASLSARRSSVYVRYVTQKTVFSVEIES